MSRSTAPRPADAQCATVWTIGHSTRSGEEFASILAAHAIEVVVDVRRFPGSRRHPQFGAESMERELAVHGIAYWWIAELGGRRRIAPGPLQAGWRNPSFASYAAFLQTDEFADGMAQLLHAVHAQRTAIMCSEALWWRCHRALISDVLCVLGHPVLHIAGTGRPAPHPYTAPARVVGGELSYPA